LSVEEALLEVASENAKKAIIAERQGRKNDAIIYYYRAISALKKLVKIEDREEIKRIYEKRLKEYSRRVMDLLSETKRMKKRIKKAKGEEKESEELEDIIKSAIIIEKPKVRFEDIANLEKAKKALMEAIIWPLKRPDLFKGSRSPWRGIRLFGPPGCGKTLLAKAVANAVNATFINIDSATILSKWFGESEKIVKEVFRVARKKQPAIIFIDEVDAIASIRKADEHDTMHRVKTILLMEMDGLLSSSEDRIVVIGATNLPELLDPAFRRRFEKRIYVPLPDFEARKEIFKIHLRGIELADDVDFDELAKLTEGYTGHDIALIVKEAVMRPIRELAEKNLLDKKGTKPRPVNMNDFREAIKIIKPSVSPEEIKKYEEWARKFATG